MKKYLKLFVLAAVFMLCSLFFINERGDIKTLEMDVNEGYHDYEMHKENYKLTTGRITVTSEQSIKDKDNLTKFVIGEYPCTCIIEFETEDGKKITDKFFPFDTKNDSIGKSVQIAYYVRTDINNGVVAARTEYIPDRKHLSTNMIWIVVFMSASAGVFGYTVFRILRTD